MAGVQAFFSVLRNCGRGRAFPISAAAHVNRDLVDRGAAAFETLDDGLAHLGLGLGEGERRAMQALAAASAFSMSASGSVISSTQPSPRASSAS